MAGKFPAKINFSFSRGIPREKENSAFLLPKTMDSYLPKTVECYLPITAFFGEDGPKGKSIQNIWNQTRKYSAEAKQGSNCKQHSQRGRCCRVSHSVWYKAGLSIKKENGLTPDGPAVEASAPNDRTILDTTSPLGITTTRYEDRIWAALCGGGGGYADIEPDLSNQTLTVTLHTFSEPRFNEAAIKLAELLTNTESIFPETGLRIIFKTHSEQTGKGKEF